jgi:hypothetical protein
MKEKSTTSTKDRPFPGDKENSPQKPPRQVGPEAHNPHGQFLSSINTGHLYSILTSWNTLLMKEKCTISTKNGSFPRGLQNSPG